MIAEVGHEHLLRCGRELDFGQFPGPVARHKVRETLGGVVELAIESGQLTNRVRGTVIVFGVGLLEGTAERRTRL